MVNVLVDTGAWYALCDPRDTTVPRSTIEDIYRRLEVYRVILPWPIAYETLRTSFVKNRLALERFEHEAKKLNIDLFDDRSYRERAYQLVFESGLRRGRPLSMVDCLLRLLIEDDHVRIDGMITFNLRDFVDVCRKRRIELWVN